MRILMAAILLAPLPAYGQQAVLGVGIGIRSCATWLQSSDSELEGGAWILGFWTGSNMEANRGAVGATTDSLGIIAAVKARCEVDPAASVTSVVGKMFDEFAAEGR